MFASMKGLTASMRTRYCLVMSSVYALVAAASGCSDDNAGGADSAVKTASAAGHSGAASGGAGGKGPVDVTPEECVEQTTDVFKDRTDGYGSECVSCLCEQSPKTIALCNEQDACWGLLLCVAAKCVGKEGMDESNCAVESCGQFIEGAAVAMVLEVLIKGDACSAKCSMPGTGK